MGVESRSIRPNTGAAKRSWRNYLLEPRFQLKYTGMVVAVTVLVASVLGYQAYDYSKGQTVALQIQMTMANMDLDAETIAGFDDDARAEDRKVLAAIVGGISILAICIAIMGIFVTHRLVGPAFKMQLLFRHVAKGHLRVQGPLRKGDELQDVFKAFEAMIDTLREKQVAEIGLLEEAIQKAKAGGVSEDSLKVFSDLRDRMQAELD
jgi:methyl-accepting chemotaxis protein